MGNRIPRAEHCFKCHVCKGCYSYSLAYERAGFKPKICADCSMPVDFSHCDGKAVLTNPMWLEWYKLKICAGRSAPKEEVMVFETKSRKVMAEQYIPGRALPPGVKLGNLGMGTPEAYVISNQGTMVVHSGDWVVEELDGTYYPVPDDIFTRKYQAVA